MDSSEYTFESIKDFFRKSISKKENIDDFFIYLKLMYEEGEYHPYVASINWEYRSKFNDYIDALNMCMFLQEIPKDDWEINIYPLIRWGQRYFNKDSFEKEHTNKPSKERKKHIPILEKSKEILELFLPKVTDSVINNRGTVITSYEGKPLQDTFFMEKLHKDLTKAIEDLENKEYKIFPREYYYGSKEVTLNEITSILRGIAKKYNIPKYSDDIRDLKNSINFFS